MARPSSAPRLLSYLMWAHPPSVLPVPGTGYLRLPSIQKVAMQLGTKSWRVREWLEYLERQGFLSQVQLSSDRRSVSLLITTPPNIGRSNPDA